jgi:hypothetical protein
MARLDLAMRAAPSPRGSPSCTGGRGDGAARGGLGLRRLDGLSELEQQVVRDMAERLVRRVLYPVSRSIRLDEATDDETEESLSA